MTRQSNAFKQQHTPADNETLRIFNVSTIHTQTSFNLLVTDFFFQILAHPVFQM